ncbi:MAG: DEAD/DEAH box helicase [Nitrososphaerota archaeon]
MRKTMLIDHLPVSQELKEILQSLGYRELYPTQSEAVEAGLLDGNNLLLSTPTASGKTLVAMIAAGKTLSETGGKVAYMTPLRALAYEKYEEFLALRELSKPDGRRVNVMVSTGDYDSSGEELRKADVLIMTNEKFDSLTRQRPTWIKSFSVFIFDEVHLLGDGDRGATLEIAISKVRTMNPSAQLISLSATVSNGGQIAEWLDAKHVDLNWRPVPLKEGVAYEGKIFFSDGTVNEYTASSPMAVIDLAVDAVDNGGQALVFTETRRRAISLAIKAAPIIAKHLSFDESARLRPIKSQILDAAEETELTRIMVDVVAKGVAFHHAGLAAAHRRIVEKAFKEGLIKVLFATPTLAAGVNTPARRVILASLSRYDSSEGMNKPISVMDYKQMSGRAGRPKYDPYGEAILLASNYEDIQPLIDIYIKGRPEMIRSQLASANVFRKHTLGIIAGNNKINQQDLMHFFANTLLAKQYGEHKAMGQLESSLSYLEENALITRSRNAYLPTRLGKRIATLYIDPETGLEFVKILRRIGDTEEDLTAGFLEVIVSTPDFEPKMQLRAKDYGQAEVFEEVHGSRMLLPADEEWFRSVMVLYSWLNESTDQRIMELYGVEPGDLHRCVEMAEWLAYSFRELARLIGYNKTGRTLDKLRIRISAGIKEELIPLVLLEGIGRVRARSLFDNGYRSIERIASADIAQLSRVPKVGDAIARRIKKQAVELVARGSNA